MRLHLRRFVLPVLLSAVFICFIFWYKRVPKARKWRKGNYLYFENEGKLFQERISEDDIFWTEMSGVEKVHHGGTGKRLEKKTWIDDKFVDSFKNMLRDDSGSKQIRFNLNTDTSDSIPLNRNIPDSRPKKCQTLSYPVDLPTTSIVIPFHNEWPSVLMRTVHSLVNGTPKSILKQIILVDDASDLGSLKARLDNYVKWTFREGLVKIVRLQERHGLIQARLEGFKHVTGEVVSFFDSHMEVNKDWLQPLLSEIVKNPKTVAMAQLDYIDRETFRYNFYDNYRTRYGFKWDMEFFETYFRPDQLKGKAATDPLPGVLMVGPGFAVKSQYFRDLGLYDSGMKIWGGENIEFAWRTWMCGGQLLHVPCSRVGHIERLQPYNFPQGRQQTEMLNYKRAAEVWMGPYKEYVFDALPGMKSLDAGNLDERMEVKEKLQCKDFTWFLENIWPELLPYQHVGSPSGQVKSAENELCLDNNGYLFKDPVPLEMNRCLPKKMIQQGFALTSEGQLRTTLHCVVVIPEGADLIPFIQNCMLGKPDKWGYDTNHHLIHVESGLCLHVMSYKNLVLQPCQENLASQRWIFF